MFNDSQLLCLFYDNVHASGIFNETLKTWREKPDINKTYANFVPFMNQQENYCLNNKPTSVTADFINTMVGSIVHYKMKEFINQMRPFY